MKQIPVHAIDALRQLVLDPLTRPHWDRLLQQYDASNNQTFRDMVIENVSSGVPKAGLSGFYRGVFLAHILHQDTGKAEAAQALFDLRPVNIDRIMSFICFENAVSIYEAVSKDLFHARAHSLKLPQLLKLASDCIQLNRNIKANLNSQRIAIYSLQINDRRHPPTNLLFDHAHLLKKMGYEVHVFSAQELEIPHSNHYLSNGGHLINWPFDPNLQHDSEQRQYIDVTLANPSFSLLTRYEQIIAKIIDFSPSLVFFVGDCSPLVEVLFRTFPVISLNTNSTLPLGHSDLWLAANQKVQHLDAIADTHYFQYSNRIKPPDVKAYPKKKHAADRIELLTIGSRLPVEIKGTWAQKMLDLVESDHRLVWKLIGGQGAMPEALAAKKCERIVVQGYTPEIGEHLAAADIYVNPHRLGGGFSVAEAMAFSLPVLSYSETDGGDKLLEHAVETDQQYFDLLNKLIQHSSLRQELGARLRELFDTNLNLDNAPARLNDAIKQAKQFAAERLVKGSMATPAIEATPPDSVAS